MKALLLILLLALGLTPSLLADGPWVYLSGTLTSTTQILPPFYASTTEKNFFLLDQTNSTLLRYRIYAFNGVKRYQNLGTLAVVGSTFPSNKTLKTSILNYDSITVNGATRTFVNFKGVPNAATGKAIGNVNGAFPSSLSYLSQVYYSAGANAQRFEVKGSLTVLRPLSKAANTIPDIAVAAEARLTAELRRLGYQP